MCALTHTAAYATVTESYKRLQNGYTLSQTGFQRRRTINLSAPKTAVRLHAEEVMLLLIHDTQHIYT
jgi:hypothetical protein